MRKLFLYANLYHSFGFNVTHIVPKYNEVNKPNKNKFKAASNDYSNLHYNRQKFEDILSFNWEDATGVGAIMGFGNLRALDFDRCNDLGFISEVLSLLDLPIDYEWIARTGSGNGFHIYILAEQHNYPTRPERTKALKPNSKYKDKFYRVELRWNNHLVMPPSLSESNKFYEFVNYKVPLKKPHCVNNDSLENMVNTICRENNKINACIIKDIDDPQYYYGHYLDLAPVFLDTAGRIIMPNETDYYEYQDDYDPYESIYEEYGHAYGYDDDTINSAFEGDPENYWNID